MEKALIYSFLAISIGANIVQQYKIGNYGMYSDLMNQKDSFTQNGYSELLISHLNGIKTEQMEVAKNQGKIEGILSVVNNARPEENEISSIWHSGYYRGLNQVEDVRAMAYEDGYHRATEDGNCPAAVKAQKDALIAVPTTTEKPKLTKPNQETPMNKTLPPK